jgi:hypothetical protein
MAPTKRFGTGVCKRKTCGSQFKKLREDHLYCKPKCQVADAVRLHRKRQKTANKTHYIKSTPTPVARTHYMPPKQAPMASQGLSRVIDGLQPYVWPEENKNPLHGSNPDGSTPGALQGDYPLEYYADGQPKLPACLDRRKPKLAEAA